MGKNAVIFCYVAVVIQRIFLPFSAEKLANSLIEGIFEGHLPVFFGKYLLKLHKKPGCMNFPVPEILKEKTGGALCREKWSCAA